MDKKRRVDTAYEIYLGLYQAITVSQERQKLFKEFSPGFFQLGATPNLAPIMAPKSPGCTRTLACIGDQEPRQI